MYTVAGDLYFRHACRYKALAARGTADGPVYRPAIPGGFLEVNPAAHTRLAITAGEQGIIDER